MNILRRIRLSNEKTGVQMYNQFRMGLTIRGPLLIIAGIAAFCGYGTIMSKGEEVTGTARVIDSFLFVGLGVLFCYLRITVFSEKRYNKKT